MLRNGAPHGQGVVHTCENKHFNITFENGNPTGEIFSSMDWHGTETNYTFNVQNISNRAIFSDGKDPEITSLFKINNISFEGSFSDTTFNGTLIMGDRNKFVGTISGNMMTGRMYFQKDGYVNLLNGRMIERRTHNPFDVFENGTFFENKLWNGTRHFAKGEKVNYLNGKMTGPGLVYYKDGNMDNGTFVADQLWNGTRHFAEGGQFNYLNGIISGPGTIHFSNGDMENGTDVDDKL